LSGIFEFFQEEWRALKARLSAWQFAGAFAAFLLGFVLQDVMTPATWAQIGQSLATGELSWIAVLLGLWWLWFGFSLYVYVAFVAGMSVVHLVTTIIAWAFVSLKGKLTP
jgi:hypothetical protein